MSDMENVVQFPDLGAIEGEAATWIARLDSGTASAAEIAAFREWQSRSTHHREAVSRLSAIWADFDQLKDSAAPLQFETAPSSLIGSSIRSRLTALVVSRPTASYSAAAAAMAIAVSLVVVFLWTGGTEQTRSYHTDVGVQKTVSLSDGSSILLNTDSRLDVRFSSNARDVRLVKGEAYFEVAPDKHRPFSVLAGDGMVRAVGTAFAVRLLDKSVEVTVTKGNVELAALSDKENPVAQGPAVAESAQHKLGVLAAGQNALFHEKVEQLSLVTDTEINRRLAWRQGILIFSGEPLAQVVADVSRYTTVNIQIQDQSLNQLRVEGYFKVGEVDAMLEALEKNFGVRVQRVSDTLVQLYPAS